MDENVKIGLYYKIANCLDGYIALIGCQTIDDDSWFTIIGIGVAKEAWKALFKAKKSTATFLGIEIDAIELLEVGKSTWQLPDQEFADMEKEFFEFD